MTHCGEIFVKYHMVMRRTTPSSNIKYHFHLSWMEEGGGFWNEYRSHRGVIFFWKNILFFPLDFLLLVTQDNYELSSTYIFILPILKTNSKTLLPQHILDTPQILLPQPSTSPWPFLKLHFPHLGYHYWPHPGIILVLTLFLFILHVFSKRWVHGSWGVGSGDVLEVII